MGSDLHFSPQHREARRLAALGFRVFPLVPGGKRWLTDKLGCGWPPAAPLPIERLDAWWRRLPQANIGIATGVPYSGGYIFVVDTDRKAGRDGEWEFESLTGFTAAWLDTMTAATPHKGYHRYYVTDRPMRSALDFPRRGIDQLGMSHHATAPGSRLADGRSWRVILDRPPAPLPSSLAEALGALPRDDAPQGGQAQ